MNTLDSPGLIALFGSGETSPNGRKIFDAIMHRLSVPVQIALLETPAGFEPNSAEVIGRVADFLRQRLQNYQPQVTSIPARQRKPPYSTDDPKLTAPLLQADMIFMGPGSPTYAVRQLRDSLAWQYLQARQRLGGVLALASAATVAMSRYALPVYEIYKVGEDLHWKEGLNFFGTYGLDLVFIPHWNNAEGGETLDTSRCFMGQARFARLMTMLPSNTTVVGLDEQTALVMDIGSCTAQVIGLGNVTLLHLDHEQPDHDHSVGDDGSELAEISRQRGGHVHIYQSGERFPLSAIGPFHPAQPETYLPPEVWQRALQAAQEQAAAPQPPQEVLTLINERKTARANREWQRSDELREQIQRMGWQVKDTRDGMQVERNQS